MRGPRNPLPLAHRFTRACEGVAAAEFALILPFLMALYVGTVELTQVLANSRKITQLSRTLADLASRGVTLSQSEADAIFDASAAVLAPFDGSKAKMVISAIGVYKVGSDYKAYVCSSASSSKSSGGNPLRSVGAPGSVAGLSDFPEIPQAFKQDQMRYILAEVRSPYTYVTGSLFETLKLGSFDTLGEQTVWPVRTGKTYNSTYPEIVLPKSGKPCPAKIT